MDDIYRRITNDGEFGADVSGKSDIRDFFTDQTIFLTGGTGFLGKCFVEKLLRACPNVRKLYIMVRPLKKSIDERMEEYFQNVLFDKLRNLHPNFRSKVAAIEGNLMMENLGLSEADRNLIIDEVTMVIHAGSNVKFAAPISKLFRANVLGTQYMLNLAERMKNLQIFVYLSTAFSHCYQQHIEDICYESPADLKMVMDLIDVDEKTPGGISDTARQQMQQPWPNMYAYSKAIAESLVSDFAKSAAFRCTIFRPSIVMSTYEEPIKGWIGNGNGPTLMVIGWALGFIHVGYKGNSPGDVIPADMCTNALFATTWDAVVNREEKCTALVYNYASSTVNQKSVRELEEFLKPRVFEMPSSRSIQWCWKINTDNKVPFWILHYLLHFSLAAVFDAVLLVMRRKPIGLKIISKTQPNISWLLYFTNGNWRIHIRSMRNAWDRMSETDKHLFYCDLRTLDWENFCYHYWPGLRAYLLNETISCEKDAKIRKRIKGIRIISYGLFVIFVSFVLFYFRHFLSFLMLPFYDLHELSCKV